MSFSPLPRRWRSAMTSVTAGWWRGRPGRAVARRVVEDEHLGRERQRRALGAIASSPRSSSSRCSVLTTQKETSTRHGGSLLSPAGARHVVDPSAYTPPYDHALCAALARAGAHVGSSRAASPTATCRAPDGYAVASASTAAPRRRARAPRRGEARPPRAGHARGARARPAARADVVHFQWLAVQPLDARPAARVSAAARPDRPRRPAARAAPGPARGAAGALPARRRGRRPLRARRRAPRRGDRRRPAKVTVIPHGVLAPSGRRRRCRRARRRRGARRAVLRPPAPVQGPRRAARRLARIEGAELWVVGMPRMDTAALRASAPPGVRFVERFVAGRAVAALFQRADLAVLPYRRSTSPACFHRARRRDVRCPERRRRFPRGRGRRGRRARPARRRRGAARRLCAAARRSGCPRAPRRRGAARGGGALRLGRDRRRISSSMRARGMSEWRETNPRWWDEHVPIHVDSGSTTSRRSWRAARRSAPSRSTSSATSTA